MGANQAAGNSGRAGADQLLRGLLAAPMLSKVRRVIGLAGLSSLERGSQAIVIAMPKIQLGLRIESIGKASCALLP